MPLRESLKNTLTRLRLRGNQAGSQDESSTPQADQTRIKQEVLEDLLRENSIPSFKHAPLDPARKSIRVLEVLDDPVVIQRKLWETFLLSEHTAVCQSLTFVVLRLPPTASWSMDFPSKSALIYGISSGRLAAERIPALSGLMRSASILIDPESNTSET